MMMMMMTKYLVLTLVVISSRPISIYAEKELMMRECRNAQFPTVCMQCLESDPASVVAGSVAIAGIVINCLDSHLHTLIKQVFSYIIIIKIILTYSDFFISPCNITELLSKKVKGHDEMKAALKDCKKDLLVAMTLVPDAKNCLEAGDYNKAGQSIQLALGFPLQCRENLETSKFQFSPSFRQIITIYAQLSVAAMRIIDRF
ncbi:unnamed protein product [Microthlaspi erraticum]|uniref:Uncharacterized protein n=1 Tax=Microthlaspi erraticum TaxID=1685480 RepID=A0A6D2IIH8_9BRAS|nr:unnamed protein product [Microthlaspi erraticum]